MNSAYTIKEQGDKTPKRILLPYYVVHVFLLLLSASLLIPTSLAFASETPDTKEQPALFVEILDFARLSKSVYEPEDAVTRIAKQMGNELTIHEHSPGLGITYFLLTDIKNKVHWVAVRGTVNVKNTLVNLDLQLIPNEDIGIQLHSGFAESAKEIFHKIKPALKKGFKIKITGHSLGGAVATALAIYLDFNNYPVTKVVTFGQPKVTNITGALKFEHIEIWRVVTESDFVPLLPPVDAVDINNVGIFWPMGQEIILLDKNRYSMAKGLDSMLRATKFLNKLPDTTNLQHHQIAHYMKAIEDRQEAAEYIPYKNDFSIFSIFGNGK